MNRKQFFKTLIGGVISAPIVVHELQSQSITGYAIDTRTLVLYPTGTIAIGTATPNHKLIVKSNNDSRTK